jgi:cation diffusion facilitator CzcD-associated flavoprotein CzcO
MDMYSYSFMSCNWSSTHADWQEIQQYLEKVVDHFALRPHIRFGVAVDEVEWRDSDHCYDLRTNHGEQLRFDVVISAVGLLNIPSIPDWPGLGSFEGPVFHTARWEHQHDLRNKVVAVVGTGSSAAQVVPALANVVRKLYLFQREPGWVLPKEVRALSEEERARAVRPLTRRIRRLNVFYQAERELATGLYNASSRTNMRLQKTSQQFIDSCFAGRPELRRVMTPSYPYLCKRVVKSSDFYPSLLRDNVEVVPRAVEAVTPSGVIDAAGIEHHVDIIITATGFQADRYIDTVDVRGHKGVSLHKEWSGEPEAFLGIMVPKFPNFFMLYGPNTNGGALIFNFERQAEYAVRAIRRMQRRGYTSVEVRQSSSRRYNQWLQSALRKTTYASTCHNYFRSPSGKIVTQWPFTMSMYWLLTRLLGPVAWISR